MKNQLRRCPFYVGNAYLRLTRRSIADSRRSRKHWHCHKITSGDFVYTVEDNVATIVDYTGSANALVIPQTIDGRKIVRIGDYALSKKQN